MKDTPLDSTDLTWLAGLARALVHEPHAADDLVQDTVLAAMTAPAPSSPRPRAWLAGVARRLAARRFRGEARRRKRERRVARPEAVPDDVELLAKAEVAEHVTAAARRLPEPFRRAVLLRFLEGRSVADIARLEGKPADTIRWRLRRGLALLREDLVRRHDRDWASWCVLLVPLGNSRRETGHATAGRPGAWLTWVAAGAVMGTSKTVWVSGAVLALCVGIWWMTDSGRGGADRSGEDIAVVLESGDAELTTTRAKRRRSRDRGLDENTAATLGATAVSSQPQVDLVVASGVHGRVVGENGAAISGATVYLIPSPPTEQVGSGIHSSVLTRTVTDEDGTFRIEEGSWSDAGAGLDLGVVADGWLRQVVSDAVEAQPGDGWVVTMLRGRTLTGRVVDEFGAPVDGLTLLAHTEDGASIEHVSPSQMRLRSERAALGDARSAYHECHATTDRSGTVTFAGLPDGDLQVRTLEPGWILDGPKQVEAGPGPVEWTAHRRIGVRLEVVDADTGRPVEQASAVFRVKLTLANGGEQDLEQWVGRGAGGASLVFHEGLYPPLRDDRVLRATFHGTVRVGEGGVPWEAPEIVDPSGPNRVAIVRIAVDPDTPATTPDVVDLTSETTGPSETTTLELEVVHDDGATYEGGLFVSWSSREVEGRNRTGKARLDADTPGRFRLELPPGDISLRAQERFASGSLPGWSGSIRSYAGSTERLVVTLPRGGTVAVPRPDGWTGNWLLHASWREIGDTEWRGSWGYGTEDEVLTLRAVRPAEWRFQLRRSPEDEPLVLTTRVIAGETTVLDPDPR